jgi:hypothetical protein
MPYSPSAVAAPTGGSKAWTFVNPAAGGAGGLIHPGDLAELNALGIGTGPAWPVDEYIQTTDSNYARWDGATFVATAAPALIGVVSILPGTPGTVNPPGAAMYSLVDLKAHPNLGDGSNRQRGQPAWAPGEYANVLLKPGDPDNAPSGPVYWAGQTRGGWYEGIAPVPEASIVNQGAPGTWGPPGAGVANLVALKASIYFGDANYGRTAWDPGEYVVLLDGTEAYWDGTAWAAGRSGAPAPAAGALDKIFAGAIPVDEIRHGTIPVQTVMHGSTQIWP